MSTDNYYKDLWTNPKTEAGQFFNKVDFNHKDYKDQEQVFRNFLKGLKRLMDAYEEQKPIESVLEVGAGTGRITKIVLEELPNIDTYHATDIRPDKKFNEMINNYDSVRIKLLNLDITNKEFDIWFHECKYDMIVLSEVFMHIKPEHIERVIKSVTDLLAPQGVICNIDWYHQKEPSEWCYIHNYDQIYETNGLYPVFMMDINKQKLFCYGK